MKAIYNTTFLLHEFDFVMWTDAMKIGMQNIFQVGAPLLFAQMHTSLQPLENKSPYLIEVMWMAYKWSEFTLIPVMRPN